VVPGPDDLLFLPQQPYLPSGTLREVLVSADRRRDASGDELSRLLRDLGMDSALERVGKKDGEQSWGSIFSLREQQLLSIARVMLARPAFVFLDRIGTALEAGDTPRVLAMFVERNITYVAVEGNLPREHYDAALEYGSDGGWTWDEARH